jgi:hypothetical protein
VLHAALDAVDEAEWASAAQHLGVVDRFNAFQVSAFTTAGRARLLLLHDGRGDDLVRGFFKDVYELYLRVRTRGMRVSARDGGGGAGVYWAGLGARLGTAWDGAGRLQPPGSRGAAATLRRRCCQGSAFPRPALTRCQPRCRARHSQAALNPFFVPSARLASPAFHQKVKQLARSYFR